MKRKPPQPVRPDLPDFPVGSPILLVRPHLWSGCAGVVERVTDHKHLVRIAGKNNAVFHAESFADTLWWWFWVGVRHSPTRDKP